MALRAAPSCSAVTVNSVRKKNAGRLVVPEAYCDSSVFGV